ncbi:MAG TPA: hypothetical protein VJ596_12060 [Gemmatimonadaceae bacterium]|nr:hypothetical protein [Gemmatimonadaceae bacterium]
MTTLFAALLACMGSGGTGPGELGPGRPILFIGNSLTYFNDLPLVVQALADSAGGEALAVRSVTAGGYSLEDHWNGGTAPHTIAERQWSVVVLQQGPSSLPESRENLREWTRRFDGEIRRAGARTGLYMVWPEAARASAFDDVVES